MPRGWASSSPVCRQEPPGNDRACPRRAPRELGGPEVGRVLPWPKRQTRRPFAVFNHGPADFLDGLSRKVGVLPHPQVRLLPPHHLFEGEIIDRDGLGAVQPIRSLYMSDTWERWIIKDGHRPANTAIKQRPLLVILCPEADRPVSASSSFGSPTPGCSPTVWR